ncbi:MAG TPA: DUF1629 domain-containing protein [Phycisphaerae bacterium]|nr:DUF1629 domain-containing protein [Phycisphaerae bacterium]
MVESPTIYLLRSDEAFASLYVDGSDAFFWKSLDLFDGTAIADLPPIAYSRDSSDADLPIGDFIYGIPILLMSRRAVEALGSILLAHGQLFPVTASEGEFFAYNITTLVDALDREHSDMEMWPHLKREREAGIPRHIHHVMRYWFYAERVEGIDIFKLPEFPHTEVYVSDHFVYEVERTGLRGFRFERLWSPGDPMPDLRPRRLPG